MFLFVPYRFEHGSSYRHTSLSCSDSTERINCTNVKDPVKSFRKPLANLISAQKGDKQSPTEVTYSCKPSIIPGTRN